MNYFAHGFHALEQPYLLAGTAVPDWLSVADRKVRLRKRDVSPFLHAADDIQAAVAAGVCRHLDDDSRFHRTAAFYEVSGALTREMRSVLADAEGYRCGFLGHILTELLLDAVLMERHAEKIDRYYEVLKKVDPQRLEEAVNRMARRPTARLAPLIPLFIEEQFLRDYLQDEGLLYRLNQVMRRVGLKTLPDSLLPALRSGREIVRRQTAALLSFPDQPVN